MSYKAPARMWVDHFRKSRGLRYIVIIYALALTLPAVLLDEMRFSTVAGYALVITVIAGYLYYRAYKPDPNVVDAFTAPDIRVDFTTESGVYVMGIIGGTMNCTYLTIESQFHRTALEKIRQLGADKLSLSDNFDPIDKPDFLQDIQWRGERHQYLMHYLINYPHQKIPFSTMQAALKLRDDIKEGLKDIKSQMDTFDPNAPRKESFEL